MYPESCSDGNWRSHIRKVYASPRPPPKIFLEHGWKRELGSEVVLQAEVSQPTQPKPNHYRTVTPVVCSEGAPRSSNQEIETRSSSDCKNFNLDADANHYRTGGPVVCSDGALHASDQDIETRLSRDSKNFNFEEDVNHYRTVRPIVCSQRAPQTRSSRDCNSIDLDEETEHHRTVRPVVCSQQERSMSDEVDIDFRISGLPYSVVNKLKVLVFVNSLRRSRTTLTDKIFNSIYDKTKPTTQLLKSPRK